MRKTQLIAMLLVSMVSVGSAFAGDPAPAPAEKPAAKALPKPPEVMKGALDPFDAVQERNRFFAATGPDSELSQEEFAASKGQPGAFARAFDTFTAMLPFDKNRNKTIDWFEAKDYRLDLRQRVLAAYDANKDGKLVGLERDKANRALAAGKVPPRQSSRPVLSMLQPPGPEAVKAHDADKDGKLSPEERGAMWRGRLEERRADLLRKYDTNSNGELDEDEVRAITKEMTDRWTLRRFDKDGDGRLSETESAAAEEATAQWRGRFQEWSQRAKELTAKHDADGDGKLNPEERRAMWQEMRGQWMTRRFDKDGDGKLNPQEADALAKAEAERKAMYEKWQGVFVKRYDRDGDGALSPEERRTAMADIGEEVRKIAADWMQKWDTDGDGQLSDEENQVMRGAVRQRADDLKKQIDTDEDGKVSPEERRAFFKKLRETYDLDGDGTLSPDELKAMIQDQIRKIQPREP